MKSSFSPERLGIWAEILYEVWLLIDIKMKKSVSELGYNGRLKIYVDPKKIYVNPGI